MFPTDDYQKTIQEAMAIMADRDAKGRNDALDFYQQFPHGYQDLTFECHRRTIRILGAEKKGDLATMRGDAIDLVNYAAFLVMLIDQASAAPETRLTHHTDADRASHL